MSAERAKRVQREMEIAPSKLAGASLAIYRSSTVQFFPRLPHLRFWDSQPRLSKSNSSLVVPAHQHAPNSSGFFILGSARLASFIRAKK